MKTEIAEKFNNNMIEMYTQIKEKNYSNNQIISC